MQVSDGQRRRVQLLLTLVRPFKILLLDEVTTSLGMSQTNQAELVELSLPIYIFLSLDTEDDSSFNDRRDINQKEPGVRCVIQNLPSGILL